jgi:hypothetical protein
VRERLLEPPLRALDVARRLRREPELHARADVGRVEAEQRLELARGRGRVPTSA